jgi:hypothetical protein
MDSCIDLEYFLPDSFLPIFLVSLTVADSTGRRQNLLSTLNETEVHHENFAVRYPLFQLPADECEKKRRYRTMSSSSSNSKTISVT